MNKRIGRHSKRVRYSHVLRWVLAISGALFSMPLSLAQSQDQLKGVDVQQQPFGKTREGAAVMQYQMSNGQGMSVSVIDYGATLTSLVVPDREGKLDDVVLGGDSFKAYETRGYGAVIGRYANRIGHARFPLDGKEIQVTQNAGQHHIHGGRKGFARVVWKGQVVSEKTQVGVRLTYVSQDGEEGFPGKVTCHVTYILTQDNELKIQYQATTDKPTVINLTNHAYFNLAGAGQGKVYDHILWLDANTYTVPDEALIPTGEIRSVKNTPLDFTQPLSIGSRINQLQKTRGYDHNYVFNDWDGTLRMRATVYDPLFGRVLEMSTTEPGVQLYTANHFQNVPGRKGAKYQQHGAFCLETQHFPDSPNKPDFPSTVLRPGKPFESETVFSFSTGSEKLSGTTKEIPVK